MIAAAPDGPPTESVALAFQLRCRTQDRAPLPNSLGHEQVLRRRRGALYLPVPPRSFAPFAPFASRSQTMSLSPSTSLASRESPSPSRRPSA